MHVFLFCNPHFLEYGCTCFCTVKSTVNDLILDILFFDFVVDFFYLVFGFLHYLIIENHFHHFVLKFFF